MVEPMISPDDYGREVAQYDPVTVVEMCADASRNLEKQGKTFVQGVVDGQHLNITQHGLSELAMWAIRNHHEAATRTPSIAEHAALAHNVYSIRDPFLGTPDGGLMGLFRTAYEQFPYQEPPEALIPRHLILYLETAPTQMALDVNAAFTRDKGLSLQDFLVLAVLFWTAALQRPSFPMEYVSEAAIDSLRPYLRPEKLAAFLDLASADFEALRAIRLYEEDSDPALGRYTLNPLWDRPIVRSPNGLLSVPVPRLLIRRATYGVYYDLLEAFRDPTRQDNPFQQWFGYAFEDYVGLLFKDSAPDVAVWHEQRYGKPQKDGPDWTVDFGYAFIAAECKSGRPGKNVRASAVRSEIERLVWTNVTNPAIKLAGKIEDLRSGSTGILLGPDADAMPLVVTYDGWQPVLLTKEIALRMAAEHGESVETFEIAPIGDLEWLLRWAPEESPVRVLLEKQADAEGQGLDVGQYVGVRAKRAGKSIAQLNVLKDARQRYLADVPGFGSEPAGLG